ncbi:uncharacterized protein LAESUDRAFT_113551 [Laetiporus sulphureus 93-53]|uniref:Uncharacterized protein n=1 Tax=Laetiporus sulphureus 93-53 TaxID=1314785 RepID=A0A165EPY1_9APHY|nr:uncharacterized protein LAESUDRAFT_113551 [Laetiporus sulphureus 93-53]KZT07519.1 hypothetical protein LAESUDRAFT_113551 [Laetiporus sulphureus 93-53]
MRKGCLKHSPPQTPELSHSPWTTPSASGRTSPAPSQCAGPFTRPPLRKNVSFCEDSTLEEVFFADEWDRSPAPVTPKLSYSDVLELKQLLVSLPRAPPPPPTPRQPFTTSLPRDCHTPYEHSCSYPYPSSSSSSSSSSSAASSFKSQPFPCSRFASQPSQTPDRWKNRSQFARPIDPEILPYLEAVPIRLLPLLDSSAQEPEPEPSIPPPTPASVRETPKVSSLESCPNAACMPANQHHERDRQPSPSFGPDSNCTVTPSSRSEEISPAPSPPLSSSPHLPPASSSSSMPSSQATTPPPPSSQPPHTPPSITLHSPSGTQRSPAVPPSPSPSPSPSMSLSPSPSKPHAPLRPPPLRMNMAFVPLLPAQDAPKPAESRREEGKEERRPKRQMNFAFVPLMEKQAEEHIEGGWYLP